MWDNESEYLAHLEAEREGYAWVLVKHGRRSVDQAIQEAEEFYDYEPQGTEFRGVVFHDEAWHWAMKRIFGEQYHLSHPELANPSEEYNTL